MAEEPPWYYRDGAESRGPFNTESLRLMLSSGEISSATLVARSGWSSWRTAGDMFPDAALEPAPVVDPAASLPAAVHAPALATPVPVPVQAAPTPARPLAAVSSPVPTPVPASASGPTPRPRASPSSQPPPRPSARGQERSAEEAQCIELRCVSGPDAGTKLWVGPGAQRLDRESLRDPAAGTLWVEPHEGRLRIRVESGPALEVDGRPVSAELLQQGARFRYGSSVWQVGAGQIKVEDLVAMLGDRLNRLASVDKLEGFSLREMFSEVFAARTQEEIDDYFLVGTAKTTPAIEDVETGWPKPWLFGRILLFLGLIYLGFFLAVRQFDNPRLLPGLILMGSIAVPFATLILFYELNTPRNVSFRTVLSLFFLGGVVSLLVSMVGFDLVGLSSWLGASSAGIVEETGKLITVVLIARGARHRYILNGLLFGAAVGAGFAAFESAGYAFWDALMATRSLDATTGIIMVRGLLAPFAHVAWTAFAAGVLWRVKGDRPFSPAMLADKSFLKAFLIPVVLHMVWNAPLPSPFWIRHLLLGAMGWYVLFALVQQGLRQVRDEQRKITRQQLQQTRTSLQMSIVPPASS